ncbi:hypothetical protein [Anaerovibrio sp. RM50]|uniref:tetratricopeptide repeat protein n=1 Tax=Anaerovibrio sp. RM50 TaxID=1200557 RepID=UPI0004842013|nr:hypothetical protein [Anaerovibrio sp. RM50]
MEHAIQINKKALERAMKHIDNSQFDKALPVVEKLVAKFEKLNTYKDDENTEYHSFHEKLEELLYEEFTEPEKEICNIDEPISDLYLAYGSALLGLERKEEAKKALLTALRWNPADPSVHLKFADLEIRNGNNEEVLKYASEAMKWAFHTKDIGNCYYYFGWYAYQKESYAAAFGYYHLCSDIGDGWRKFLSVSEQMMIHINGIAEPPTLEDMEKYSIQLNIPLGYNSKIVDFVLAMGDGAMEDYEPKTAYYFYSILYEITGSENVLETLEELEEEYGIVFDDI